MSHYQTLHKYVATLDGPTPSPSSKDTIRLGTVQKIPVHTNKARHSECTIVAPNDVNGTIAANVDENVTNGSGLELPSNTSTNKMNKVGLEYEAGLEYPISNNTLSGKCNLMSRQHHQDNAARGITYQGNIYGKSNYPNMRARQANGSRDDEKSRLHFDSIGDGGNLPQKLLAYSSSSLRKSSSLKKSSSLDRVSSTSTLPEVRDEMTATGLELSKNGIIDENLSTVTDDLEKLMEKTQYFARSESSH